jgi:hypothetical protein
MKRLCFLLGILALGLTVVPPFLFMTGALACEDCMKRFLLAGTILWFIAWPVASRPDKPAPGDG